MIKSNKFFKMEDVIQCGRRFNNLFRVSWKMLDYCPYSCSYCYMSDTVKASKIKNCIPSLESQTLKAIQIYNYLKFRKIPLENVSLHLIGGEVTYYDLVPILEKMSGLQYLEIVTNFYRDIDYWYNLLNYISKKNFKKFNLTVSLHLETINTKEKFNNFIKKLNQVKEFYKKYIWITIKLITTNSNFNLIETIVNILKTFNFDFSVSFARDNNQQIKQLPSQEILKKIDSLNNRYFDVNTSIHYLKFKDGTESAYKSSGSIIQHSLDGSLNFENFICDAGTHGISIDIKGNILGSRCALLINYGKLGILDQPETWINPEKIQPFICTPVFKNKQGRLKGHTCTPCYKNIMIRNPEKLNINYYEKWLKEKAFQVIYE